MKNPSVEIEASFGLGPDATLPFVKLWRAGDE
jgi:hypothetical protein